MFIQALHEEIELVDIMKGNIIFFWWNWCLIKRLVSKPWEARTQSEHESEIFRVAKTPRTELFNTVRPDREKKTFIEGESK